MAADDAAMTNGAPQCHHAWVRGPVTGEGGVPLAIMIDYCAHCGAPPPWSRDEQCSFCGKSIPLPDPPFSWDLEWMTASVGYQLLRGPRPEHDFNGTLCHDCGERYLALTLRLQQGEPWPDGC